MPESVPIGLKGVMDVRKSLTQFTSFHYFCLVIYLVNFRSKLFYVAERAIFLLVLIPQFEFKRFAFSKYPQSSFSAVVLADL